MLFQIGPVSVDTFPFSAETVSRSASADHATKAIIGTLPAREFMGEGDDQITLSGQLLPMHIGGLTELTALHEYRRKGTRLPVQRGDGLMLGWFVITALSEAHDHLNRYGVGGRVSYSISLMRTGVGDQGVIATILSLFGV